MKVKSIHIATYHHYYLSFSPRAALKNASDWRRVDTTRQESETEVCPLWLTAHFVRGHSTADTVRRWDCIACASPCNALESPIIKTPPPPGKLTWLVPDGFCPSTAQAETKEEGGAGWNTFVQGKEDMTDFYLSGEGQEEHQKPVLVMSLPPEPIHTRPNFSNTPACSASKPSRDFHSHITPVNKCIFCLN